MKNKIINKIIDVEGGYINDPDDSGGETNYGITVRTAREFGYFDAMRDLSRDAAFRIYELKYWDSVRADNILLLSPSVVEEVVDTAINMGVSRAGKFLQRSLNALNDRGRLYADIAVDGDIGTGTIEALEQYLMARGNITLVKMLNCLQGAFYVELAERREKDEKFINGWFNNRII